MLLKLDGRYPKLFNPETYIEEMERAPSWGVVTSDPSTENNMQGWVLKPVEGAVRLPVFSGDVKVGLSNMQIKDVFWMLQKLYWRFRYCSWVEEAVSRSMGYPNWSDMMPEKVYEVVGSPSMVRVLTPMPHPPVLKK